MRWYDFQRDKKPAPREGDLSKPRTEHQREEREAMTPEEIENALRENHQAIQDELKEARDHEARAKTHYRRVRPLMEKQGELIRAQREATEAQKLIDDRREYAVNADDEINERREYE